MVTVIEKQDKTNYKSPWDCEGDDEQPESENDNSLDQIKTYRLSNPCTPIQDLENATVGFDRLFFNKDNNSHIINNLLYGNFNISKEEIDEKLCQPEVEIFQSAVEKETKKNKISTIKTSSFHLKKILVPSKIASKCSNTILRGRNSPETIEKSRLVGSYENMKSFTKAAPIYIPTIKELSKREKKSPLFFKRRGSGKNNNTLFNSVNDMRSNYSSENTSLLNSHISKDTHIHFGKKQDKTSIRTPLQHSLRNSLLSSKHSIKILKKLTNKNSRKVMIVNNATKKLKPLFPLQSNLSRKKTVGSCNKTARQHSIEPKSQLDNSISKRNDLLLTKLCKLVKNHKGDQIKSRNFCDQTLNCPSKHNTELLIANSFKKFTNKKSKKKKTILKLCKRKPEERSTTRNALVAPVSSTMISSKNSLKDKMFSSKKNL